MQIQSSPRIDIPRVSRVLRSMLTILLLCLGLSPCQAEPRENDPLLASYLYVHLGFDLNVLIPGYQIPLQLKDSASLFKEIAYIRNFALQTDNLDLLRETELMRVHYLMFEKRKDTELVREELERLHRELSQEEDPLMLPYLLWLEARWNGEVLQNYEAALDLWLSQLRLIEGNSRVRKSLLQETLYNIGNIYYEFGDFSNAIIYLKRAIKRTDETGNRYYSLHARNTLGLCYQELKQLDSSDYYFRAVIRYAVEYVNPDLQGISSGNLGQNLMLRGQYGQAIPYLQKDLYYSLDRKDWGCAANAAIFLADIALKQGKVSRADSLLRNAKAWVERSGQYARYKNLYPLLAKLAALQHRSQDAIMYMDSAGIVKDSLARKFNSLQLLRTQQKNELQQHKAQLADLAGQEKIKTLERNTMIVLVLALMGLVIYIFLNLRRKHAHKQRLMQLELQKSNAELAIASRQLEDFSRNISEKNHLIERLEEQFGEGSNNEVLLQLQHSTILTDRDWERFRDLFERVHQGYLFRLREKYPSLSPAETRLLVLAKLRFSNKEMAAALGISMQAIHVTWHRLRKKLQLSKEDHLEELVAKV